MARKEVHVYESEATLVNGCLIHPASDVARRLYQRRHGKLSSSSIFVCHTCDNGKCILDAHHFLGYQKDNMEDARKKGRLNRSEVTKDKLRKLKLGVRFTEQARANMSAAKKGTRLSSETRAKISLASRGRKMSDESKAKLSGAIQGHTVSKEARRKISLAFKGKPLSQEHKEKIRLGMMEFRRNSK